MEIGNGNVNEWSNAKMYECVTTQSKYFTRQEKNEASNFGDVLFVGKIAAYTEEISCYQSIHSYFAN